LSSPSHHHQNIDAIRKDEKKSDFPFPFYDDVRVYVSIKLLCRHRQNFPFFGIFPPVGEAPERMSRC
jgi:hypothetical protein